MLEKLSLFGGLLIILGVFHIVGLVVALIKGDFDFKEHIGEIARGFSLWGLSVLGRPTPRPYEEASDSTYKKIPSTLVLDAVTTVRKKMAAEGWVIRNYTPRTLDCEDFAYKMKAELTYELAQYVPSGKGVPVGLIGYTRDSDSKGHVIVFVDTTDKGRLFFEPYAERQGSRKLSKKELKSINMEIK